MILQLLKRRMVPPGISGLQGNVNWLQTQATLVKSDSQELFLDMRGLE